MKNYGLSSLQANKSKSQYGNNRLTELKSKGFWDKFWENLRNPLITILIVALAINVIFALLGQTEWYEPVGIAIAILLATLVSTFSEHKNENAFRKLQEEASKIVCKVYRDNKVIEMPIDDLVVGDCIILMSGDKIPADGIILDGELQVDQAALNGETKEARKIAAPSDYSAQDSAPNLLDEYKVFRGSVVYFGNAVMKVMTVGDKSVYGQIAKELQLDDGRDSPLKTKLSNLAKGISKFGYIGGIGIALALLFQRIVVQNGFDFALIVEYCSNWMLLINDILHAVMLAVIIIVMAVPEGLPLMIAIVSALNMRKMLADNVLVRKIAGIETAGSLNILFSDKTGTITKGELEAVAFISGNGTEYRTLDKVEDRLGEIVSTVIRHNTETIVNGKKIIGGNGTERAVTQFALSRTDNIKAKVIRSIPFCSAKKLSASQIDGDYKFTIIKGAPEKIIEKCKHYYDENGHIKPLSNLSVVESKISEMTSRAMRVIALATNKNDINDDKIPDGEWVLVGIIGIKDDTRPEAISAIREVQSAGVQVVMITGDRPDTAVAIATEAGILRTESDIVLTSDELAKVSDKDLKKKLKNIRVIARALPSDKSRLVRIAQDLNLVVGMTGDGVNDSPALKVADVGFAMGSGTEVAKEAGDIIILDDNFSSIDKALLYGRTIFNSIRKFIIFQLTINVAAVLISFVAPLLGLGSPLTITQILWINLVMDTFAALAFGGEPALRRFMREKPKKRDENIVNGYMWGAILTGALLTFGLSLFFLMSDIPKAIFRPDENNIYLLTGYFAFFVFISVFNAFNARTDQMNIFDNILRNKWFLWIICLIVAVQVFMTYFGGAILRSYGLTLNEWLFVLGLAALIIPVDIIRKFIIRNI
ncbi:MAG: calcium-translocating P-type ATPase, PMCA-type [Alphaproteobacteria bacterium]|nr:calcium-translocating P-type ATPase, PMCA-type [Alphaproteobacteria bacterium]